MAKDLSGDATRVFQQAERLGSLMAPLTEVLIDVMEERIRQNKKWGIQRHQSGTGPSVEWMTGTSNATMAHYARSKCQSNSPETDNWLDILLEEVFEAAAEEDADKLRAELVQVAAVTAAWIETIDAHTRGEI